MDGIKRKRSFNAANDREKRHAFADSTPDPPTSTPNTPNTPNSVPINAPGSHDDRISALLHSQLTTDPFTPNLSTARPAEEDTEDEAARILRNERIDIALEHITALQQELGINSGDELTDSDDSDEEPLEHYMDSEIEELEAHMPRFDAKTLGFMACAHETIKYLIDHGVSKDSPMLISLKSRLIEGMSQI